MTIVRRSRATALVTLALGICGLAGPPARAGSIAPPLEAMMQTASPSRRLPVVVKLRAQADVYAAAGSGTRADRARAVVQALQQQAAATQNLPVAGHPLGLLDELGQMGRNVRPFWIVNAIAVSATSPVIEACAARDDVAEVVYGGDLSSGGGRAAVPVAQWNITRVRAPDVWALGNRGDGAVVASIDTGANPLANPFLNGRQLAWHDAVRGRLSAYDESGHGSHVLGIAVGANGIGVAPEARWIACKAFRRGRRGAIRATASQILDCGQFVLNPDAPSALDPAHLPDVVLNSWWLADPGACDPFFQDMVRAWRAAQILPVFAVGDAIGTAPEDAVPSPANYPESFSVGATDQSDEMLPSSFHGTVSCGGPARSAPRVLAPGAEITSTTGRGASLGMLTGSGTAAPHAAGVAALLRSAFPGFTVSQLEEIIQRAATDFIPGPSPAYRPGLLDALAAVTFEDARFVRQVVPQGTRLTKELLRVSVTMRNTSVMTWRPGAYQLAAVSPSAGTWGPDRIELPMAEVPPLGEVVFSFDITVPDRPNLTPGYDFQWQMFHEGFGFFGEPSVRIVVPVRGYNEAAMVSVVSPPTSEPGQCWPVSVTVRNERTNAWTRAAGYRLGSQLPQDNATWGLSRVDLAPGEVVNPQTQKTFSFTACAPPVQAEYNFQWRMVQESVEWFGQYSANEIITVTGKDAAQPCGSTGVPGELRAGFGVDVGICMRNKGTNAWIGGYCLVALQDTFWGPSTVCIPQGTVVLPQHDYNFSFRVTAPGMPGRWDFGYTMKSNRNTNMTFGAFGTNIGIPLDFQASACWSPNQGACGWIFRHYDTDTRAWYRMHFAGDHWQGPTATQLIYPTHAHPNEPVARFWKSPVKALVRISGEVHDLDGGGGDGVRVLIKKNRGEVLFDTLIDNGDGAPHGFLIDRMQVDVNDTIRFIVKKRGNNQFDTTYLDPLIQVLPPDTVGSAPSPQSIFDPEVEYD